MAFWRYQFGKRLKGAFGSVFLYMVTHSFIMNKTYTNTATQIPRRILTCTKATVTTITIAYEDIKSKITRVGYSIVYCSRTTVIEMASSYCLVHKLINAEASNSKIRGLRNCRKNFFRVNPNKCPS